MAYLSTRGDQGICSTLLTISADMLLGSICLNRCMMVLKWPATINCVGLLCAFCRPFCSCFWEQFCSFEHYLQYLHYLFFFKYIIILISAHVVQISYLNMYIKHVQISYLDMYNKLEASYPYKCSIPRLTIQT
jgi:hypothetical protein